MPIYEYQCEKCDTTIEVMQSVSAKPLKKCEEPNCGGNVQRLVSASGFILKGTGWYATDYPSDARKKGWEQESKPAATGDNGAKTDTGSAAGESAPATATPATTEPTPAPGKTGPKNPYTSSKKSRAKAKK